MPDVIAPMRAVEAPEPFDSPDYIFELLWGGVRAVAHVRDGAVRFRAQNGLDLTPYFPELADLPDRLRAREAVVDGEIVATDAEGHPVFDLLRPRLALMAAEAVDAAEPSLPVQFRVKKIAGMLTYVATDLLWRDDQSLLDKALWQRKNRLHEIAIPGPEFAPVDFVDHEGIAFFDAVIDRKLEGIVAKKKASLYTPGKRSKDWLAIHALHSGDFVIGGYAIGGSHRRGEPFSQLLLGAFDQGRFEYVGAAPAGLPDKEARELVELLQPLHAAGPAFFDPPPLSRLIYWLRPKMVCHVRFSEWSPDGHLRFPIFSSLRPDLAAADCILG